MQLVLESDLCTFSTLWFWFAVRSFCWVEAGIPSKISGIVTLSGLHETRNFCVLWTSLSFDYNSRDFNSRGAPVCELCVSLWSLFLSTSHYIHITSYLLLALAESCAQLVVCCRLSRSTSSALSRLSLLFRWGNGCFSLADPWLVPGILYYTFSSLCLRWLLSTSIYIKEYLYCELQH